MPHPSEFAPAGVPDFLFIGEHPALDFANTRLASAGQLIELLTSWPAVIQWLDRAGLKGDLTLKLSAAEAPEALRRVLDFRQAWLDELGDLPARAAVNGGFLKKLNHLLAESHFSEVLQQGEAGYELVRQPAALPADRHVLALLVREVAEFLAGCDFTYLRKCASEDCVLHFYDTTKNHRRQWCSTALCGNRHKVAAFRQRQKEAA